MNPDVFPPKQPTPNEPDQPNDAAQVPEQTSPASQAEAATPAQPAMPDYAGAWTPQVIAPSAAPLENTEPAPPSPSVSDQPTPPVPTAAWPAASPTPPPSQPVVGNTPPGGYPAPQTSALSMSPVSGGSDFAAMTNTAKTKPGGKKVWLIPSVIVLVLLLATGFVFGYYLPNTPGGVYKAGLSRTAQGYDKLVSYISTVQNKHYKGYSADGSVSVVSSQASGDGTFSGQSDGSNSTGQLSVDLAGEKFSANVRTVAASGQSEPDLYLQLTGIKSVLDSVGLNSLDSLDGQWIMVDHTLLESAAASQQSQGTKSTAPSYAQIQDALQKMSAVNKQYLFTTNKKYAVLVNEEYLGKSTQEGRSVNGYKVGYDKANLKTYVGALGSALDSSSLNTWVKQMTSQTISEQLNFADLQKSIDKSNGNYTFTMYVDSKTKLIHKVHFPDSTNPANSWFEAGLNYTGGDQYPFFLSGYDKAGGSTTTGKFQFTMDSSNDSITADIGVDEAGDNPVKLTVHGTFKPSNTTVNVTAPANAKPIVQVLQSLGLGDLANGLENGIAPQSTPINSGIQAKARDTERQTDLKTLQGYIEASYAETGNYPSLAQINSSNWRKVNMSGIDDEIFKDPQGTSDQLSAKPMLHAYAYQPDANGQSYTLTAELETGPPYILKSLA